LVEKGHGGLKRREASTKEKKRRYFAAEFINGFAEKKRVRAVESGKKGERVFAGKGCHGFMTLSTLPLEDKGSVSLRRKRRGKFGLLSAEKKKSSLVEKRDSS